MPHKTRDGNNAWYKQSVDAKRKACIRSSKQRAVIKALVLAAKCVPCTDCGIQYPPDVMDLDHVRGTKRFPVSQGRNTGRTKSAILEEIKKCEAVCANCHRLRTMKRRV